LSSETPIVLGESDYDEDDYEDEDRPVERPPFDIGDLLEKDLVNSAPGLYKRKPFRPDMKHSKACEKGQGQPFLDIPTELAVGQQICIKIALPYGARGYLYGTVTKVDPGAVTG
jgi:hypothetical protein